MLHSHLAFHTFTLDSSRVTDSHLVALSPRPHAPGHFAFWFIWFVVSGSPSSRVYHSLVTFTLTWRQKCWEFFPPIDWKLPTERPWTTPFADERNSIEGPGLMKYSITGLENYRYLGETWLSHFHAAPRPVLPWRAGHKFLLFFFRTAHYQEIFPDQGVCVCVCECVKEFDFFLKGKKMKVKEWDDRMGSRLMAPPKNSFEKYFLKKLAYKWHGTLKKHQM